MAYIIQLAQGFGRFCSYPTRQYIISRMPAFPLSRCFPCLHLSSVDGSDASNGGNTLESSTSTIQADQMKINIKKDFNIKGLKAEISRLSLRAFKKVSKANEKYLKGLQEYNEIIGMGDPPMERLESCPNPDTLKADLTELQDRLKKLQMLEDSIRPIKTSKDESFLELIPIIEVLEIDDTPPTPLARGPKKVKGKKPEPRMPYFKYMSEEGIEIRVGRGASDNDELSCNPEYREPGEYIYTRAIFIRIYTML